MNRKESKKLYDDIYKLCLEHPEYQSNEFISEFLARFLRSRYQETFSEVELRTIEQVCFLITRADRVYRKVREENFEHKQNKLKQEIREQEELLALGYIV